MSNAPELKACPQCTSRYCGPLRCRFSGLKHVDVVPLPGAPFYGPDAFTDPEDLPEECDPRWDEDQFLDDPRHNQAKGLNRENRGRS